MTRLILLDPTLPAPAWAPFAGVRPLSELRAGVWTIRERWEAALDLETTALLGSAAPQLEPLPGPPLWTGAAVRGPAVIASSCFAPTGGPITFPDGTRRLTCQGATVAWVLKPDEAWHGGAADGPAAEVEGLLLGGSHDLITALERFLAPDCLGFAAAAADPVPAGSIVLGDPGLVLCRAAQIEPGVVFDTRGGAVVVEAGAEIRHGSRLEGPLFVAERARVLGGPLRASVIGPRCSVRGEISSSVFQGYANKSHDGFVGHSVIGYWVNLGAGTTTSNLKNTYGEVSLDLGGAHLPTGRQLLGSLIGDHAKTAIGTLLSTGTVVGAGANLFGAPPGKFVPPLAWGSSGADRMTEAGFLQTAARVLPRREVTVTPEVEQALRSLYHRLRAG